MELFEMAFTLSIIPKSAGVKQIHPKGGRLFPSGKLYSTGMVIVYTGDGKGKTTAALGLALRAAGYDKKVLIVQFGKNVFSGELKSLKKLKSVKIFQGGKGFVGILGDKINFQEHKKIAQKTFKKLHLEMISNKWDLIIADEILGALKAKLLTMGQILDLIKKRPVELDFVLTGRGANQIIIKKADLVTEMKKIKHPFDKNISGKKGIDF